MSTGLNGLKESECMCICMGVCVCVCGPDTILRVHNRENLRL